MIELRQIKFKKSLIMIDSREDLVEEIAKLVSLFSYMMMIYYIN